MDTTYVLHGIDYLIMAVYFLFVQGSGWSQKKCIK
jgi:hypothetical protein